MNLQHELWFHHSLFSWQWWMLIGICAVTVILFIVLVQRDRLMEAIAYYATITLLNHYLYLAASAFNWYSYPIQVIPYVQAMETLNLIVIPMVLTLLYQHFAKWGAYITGTILFSALTAYIALPLMRTFHIYAPKQWNAHLSFISLLLLAAVAKAFVDWAKKTRQARSSSEERERLVRPLSQKREKA